MTLDLEVEKWGRFEEHQTDDVYSARSSSESGWSEWYATVTLAR